MCNTKKVRRYVTRRDDRVPYLRSHTVGITSLSCVDMASWIQAEYIKVWLASLACTDMALWHRVPKGQAWVTWMMWSTWRCPPLKLLVCRIDNVAGYQRLRGSCNHFINKRDVYLNGSSRYFNLVLIKIWTPIMNIRLNCICIDCCRNGIR